MEIEDTLEILFCDLETTSLYSSTGSIVEIGLCLLDLKKGTVRPIFDKVVREPNFSCLKDRNAWVFQNTSLKIEDVLNANPLEDYKDYLQNLFDKYYFIAYNIKFDSGWLESRGFKLKKLKCPMVMSTNILKLKNTSKNIQHSNYKFPSFQEFWNYYMKDAPYKEIHRAYDDAYHEALAVYEMIKKKDYRM